MQLVQKSICMRSCHLPILETPIKYLVTQIWDWLYQIGHLVIFCFTWSSSTTKKEKEKEKKNTHGSS